jgi:uncharacterized protein YqeY
MTELKIRIQEDVKDAMRARDKARLGTLRMVTAAIKQREIDDRVVLGDNDVIAVLNKQIKQRRDSLSQYQAAGRDDLADKEAYEIEVIQEYMPEQLNADALNQLIGEAIAQTQASTVKDIGKVMARVKPKVQGRADMAAVSAEVRAQLLRSSE